MYTPRVGQFATSAFFARQKARWTYSKGNPAKYRNDVRGKIQSEKQVHTLAAYDDVTELQITTPMFRLQIHR